MNLNRNSFLYYLDFHFQIRKLYKVNLSINLNTFQQKKLLKNQNFSNYILEFLSLLNYKH